MGQIDRLKESIEALRGCLNELIEKNERGSELLDVSRQLDELLVKYYACTIKSGGDT